MKYRLLLVVALLASWMSKSYAAIVPETKAVETATMLLSQRGGSAFKGGDTQVETVMRGDKPVYYIVRYEKGGWAMIAAEDTTEPLLGYSLDSEFVSQDMPRVISDWIDEYADKIELARTMPSLQRHYRWDGDVVSRAASDRIAPLISVKWNQNYPYNKYCPADEGGANGHVYVGCVAVGMGQALSVVRYPLRGTGKKTYNAGAYGVLSVDFDKEPDYDWDAILSGANNYDEVARLLYHCGVLIDMEYGPNGSGAVTNYIPACFQQYYGFPEACVCYARNGFSGGDDAWKELMISELKRGRAVIYAGNEGNQVGHCFNLDGWDGDNMFHFNWGWGGISNGYFTLNNLGDGVQGSYPDNHRAVVGVAPLSDAPYEMKLSTTRVKKGVAVGTEVAKLTVYSDNPDAEYDYEVQGPVRAFPPGTTARNPASYELRDNKLYTITEIDDNAVHKAVWIKVTHKESGHSLEKEFALQVVDGSDAIDEVLASEFRLYPVPATEVLNMESPYENGRYTIFNVAGMVVLSGDATDTLTAIDINRLPQGSYMLRYEAKQGVVMKPFIVK